MNAVAEYKLFNSLVELPLRKFIDCAVDGNLKVLVIEGEAPEEILSLAWSDLQRDYTELLGGADAQLSLNLYKRIHKLSANLVQVHALLQVLQDYYVKEFATQLNSLLNTTFLFDVTNEEEYNRNLQSCITRSKKLELDLEIKKNNWEEIQKGSESQGEKVTREYFVEVLVALTNHSKVPITDAISTYEYCHRIKQLNKYLEVLNSK